MSMIVCSGSFLGSMMYNIYMVCGTEKVTRVYLFWEA